MAVAVAACFFYRGGRDGAGCSESAICGTSAAAAAAVVGRGGRGGTVTARAAVSEGWGRDVVGCGVGGRADGLRRLMGGGSAAQ